MASYRVFISIDAETDIEEIVDYIEARDSPEAADRIFARIRSAVLALSSAAPRGRVVPELCGLGVSEYREILANPYRIIYFISGRDVHVVAVLDGRRDLEDVLARRLLR